MQTFTAVWAPGDHDRLLSLLDVLTALRMDLTPLCGHDCSIPSPAMPAATIAEACVLLHTAIGDLRNVIKDLDRMVVGENATFSLHDAAFAD